MASEYDERIRRLRMALGDISTTAPILSDAEYIFIIEEYPDDEVKQKTVCFRTAANCLACRPVKRSLGPQSEDNTARLKYFMAEAEKLERQNSFSNTPPVPDYDSDPVFYKKMMPNE